LETAILVVQMIRAFDAILFRSGEAELASSTDTTGEANPY
jgi:hypothetical protein